MELAQSSFCEGKIGHPPEMQSNDYKIKLYSFIRSFAIEEKNLTDRRQILSSQKLTPPWGFP